ncbi:serine aminopeptidase domain-containing protein [Dyadobacter sp. CY323]|uniref:glucuronyl esterase domain-containing protein n=1 Tax=Dyadobacter sp. CY323 TaxID=2907302 RepID=UPI001F278B1A|nr:alpha/beta hydrolase [Dyadobacter sp. CY323]MCE6991102.1 alpha/beta hydrolase [Dyadobacter sp. CY323]
MKWTYMFAGLLVAGWLGGQVAAQPDLQRRRQYLQENLKINEPKDHRHAISRRVTVQDSTWLDWLHRTGELPPDFSSMPSAPFLPEPLVTVKNGKPYPIRTVAEWNDRREWIKSEFQHWVSGKIPPAPKTFKVQVLSEKIEGGTRIEMVQISFGKNNVAKMTFELMIPEGKGPFAVYMTPWTHRNWAQLAVKRGYIGCVYAGADSKDDTQAYQTLYPEYDFTALMRRAWGASRVIDYLVTRKEVDAAKIAIAGHSRNGKQALWAGAFDDRIAAVISSSCGTGGITPFRMSDPQYVNQTLDDIASNAAHWFHPRLRFFFGREDKLPIDQNLLISLIAPRSVVFQYSVVEQQLNPWASEQSYHSARKVFQFLGVPGHIAMAPRMGEHAVAARDVAKCIDFLDTRFGRKNIPWHTELQFDFRYDEWATAHAGQATQAAQRKPIKLNPSLKGSQAQTQKNEIQKSLRWLLGEEPSGVKPDQVAVTESSRIDWIDRITGRPVVKGAIAEHLGPYTALGDHVASTVYYPADSAGKKKVPKNGKIPVVIYLHEYAYAHGYAHGYSTDRQGNSKLFQTFTDRGFAVMALDLFGFGTRMEEAKYFYKRFPEWSKMGKMVSDTKACIDALNTFPDIDSDKIFLLGNTVGGLAAILTAAQDSRVAGLATVAAFSPWRSSDATYESVRSVSQWHGLIPKLGFYAEKPQDTPIDMAEIISCIAPKPLLMIAPTLDRYSHAAAVREVIKSVNSAYESGNAAENVKASFPFEINRITPEMSVQIADFFKQTTR